MNDHHNTTLTEAEVLRICEGFVLAHRAEFMDWRADGNDDPSDPDWPILHAFESILAARLAARDAEWRHVVTGPHVPRQERNHE